MKNSIEALCSEAPSSPLETRGPAFVNDEESRFEDHLGAELALAPRAKVADEPDSKEARAPKEEGEPQENDAPQDEADWEKYKLPRPELLLATVAGEHASPHVALQRASEATEPRAYVARPAVGGPRVEASPSAMPNASERASQPNQGGPRSVSPEPAMSRAANVLPQPDSGNKGSSAESAPREMGDTSPRPLPTHTIARAKPLDASMQEGAVLSANATKWARPGSDPKGDASDRHVEAPTVVGNGSANLERAHEASPPSGVEHAVENPRAEMGDRREVAEPVAAIATPKLALSQQGPSPRLVVANADGEKESGPFRAGLGRPSESASEGPIAAEPVEPHIAVQPVRMGPIEALHSTTNVAPSRTEATARPTAKNVVGRAQYGYAAPKASDERHIATALAHPMANAPTGALAPKRTVLEANPEGGNTDEAPTEPRLREGFGSSTEPRPFLPGTQNAVQSSGRRDAPVKGEAEEARASIPTRTLAPRSGPSRQRQTAADERPNGARSNTKPLAGPEDVSVPLGGNGGERGVPDAATRTSPVDDRRSPGVKAMTVDGAPLRSTDEANAAVRVAEVAGHRRALASEAHGAVTLEHVGRFEVRARPHEGGRVEVHVQAEHKAGSAMLGAHAEDLRADLRAAIPHATVDVTTPGTAGSSNGRERSSGGDASRDSSDRPTAAPHHSPPADAEQSLTASWNRRNARVRIVL